MEIGHQQQLNKQLFEVIAKTKDADEVERLFADLCTFKEVEQMAQRVQAAKQLLEGCTYEQIIARTGISSATLSRVSRCIQHCSGGYTEVLKKILDGENNNE